MKRLLIISSLLGLLFGSLNPLEAGRYYVPQIARWAIPDPALQKMHPYELMKIHNGMLLGTSPYSYTFNNPLKYTDPDGNIPAPVIGALSGAGLDIALQIATNYYQDESLFDINWKEVGVSAGLGAVGGGLVSKGRKLYKLIRVGSKTDDALNVADDIAKLADDATNIADEAGRGAFEIAKGGGKHGGLLKQYADKSTREITKALGSYEKQVGFHKEKLLNPEKFVKGWDKMDPRAKEGLLQHWQQDIKRNQELADIMRGILRERGVQ